MRKSLPLAGAALALIIMMGCAPGPNQLANLPDEEGEVAGFWKGLWHGIIAPITFIVSLFSDNVHPYEVHNSGNWYNLGFLIGMVIIFSGGGKGVCRCSRRR